MSETPCTIVGLGEVLWDIFPDGPRFGGAPANFACSTAGLATNYANVFMASGVGNDQFGSEAIEALKSHHVETSCVQVLEQPTGKVTVSIDKDKSASYEFAADAAWDNLNFTDDWKQLAAKASAVCFGTLGQRSSESKSAIQQFVRATPEQCLRVFDINIRRPFLSDDVIRQSLELANVLKLNEDELPTLAEVCELQGDDELLMKQLAERFELQCIALTRGGEGAALLRGDEFQVSPAVETAVIDTVGAGDSFTAALTLGLLQSRDLQEIGDHATQLAAFVCSQPGATPEIPDSLKL